MPRVKRGRVRATKRKRILARTKGYKWGRKNLIKQAKTAANKAGVLAFRGRKVKKSENRQIWNVQLNAALREKGLTYSKFMDALTKHNVKLNRKMLADLAQNHEVAFNALIVLVQK